MNREILKFIPPTTTRKPASIQDHRSHFESLWEESEKKQLGGYFLRDTARAGRYGDATSMVVTVDSSYIYFSEEFLILRMPKSGGLERVVI